MRPARGCTPWILGVAHGMILTIVLTGWRGLAQHAAQPCISTQVTANPPHVAHRGLRPANVAARGSASDYDDARQVILLSQALPVVRIVAAAPARIAKV